MTVQLSTTRKAHVVDYDTEVVQGDTADARFVNPDGGDVSTVIGFENDGNVVVSFPADYSGSVEAEVAGSDGGIDSGSFEV